MRVDFIHTTESWWPSYLCGVAVGASGCLCSFTRQMPQLHAWLLADVCARATLITVQVVRHRWEGNDEHIVNLEGLVGVMKPNLCSCSSMWGKPHPFIRHRAGHCHTHFRVNNSVIITSELHSRVGFALLIHTCHAWHFLWRIEAAVRMGHKRNLNSQIALFCN